MPRRYSDELKQRALRLLVEARPDFPNQTQVLTPVEKWASFAGVVSSHRCNTDGSLDVSSWLNRWAGDWSPRTSPSV
jgi:hypothetical protein